MTKLIDIEQPFVFSVISGKGGVGKTMTSVNTAAMLNKMGYQVAVIDADLGLANCATLLNETVEATVSDWISGECHLQDLIQNVNGISLITASNDPATQNLKTEVMMDALDQVISHLKQTNDFIIIDTPAGAGEMVLWALDSSQLATLVLVDEPAAISDVYRLCKYVFNIDPGYRFASIVNFAENEESAENTLKQFNNILDYFLGKKSEYFGFIPASDRIHEAIRKQHTLLELTEEKSILKELEFIAQNVIADAINVDTPISRPMM
jgi:flagellar biosynthesis protein FlhG